MLFLSSYLEIGETAPSPEKIKFAEPYLFVCDITKLVVLESSL